MTPFARSCQVLAQTYRRLRNAESSPLTLEEQKRAWALEMLRLLNVTLEVRGTPLRGRPTIFVGNHISYLDIPLLLACAPELSFVAKQELSRWPIFGRGMRLAGTIFVQRNSPASRGAARESLRRALE